MTPTSNGHEGQTVAPAINTRGCDTVPDIRSGTVNGRDCIGFGHTRLTDVKNAETLALLHGGFRVPHPNADACDTFEIGCVRALRMARQASLLPASHCVTPSPVA